MLAACSFEAREAGQVDAPPRDGPGVDMADGNGSGSGSGATAKRKPIVIDKSHVTGALDNFELYVDLSDADIAAAARADGHDIYFTDSNGAALDFERELWSGGHLIAWVRLPHLDMSANLTIYVDYGDVTRASSPDPAATFANYSAVWHLDDSLSSVAVADTTGGHAGTALGLATSAQMAGQLGGSIAFDGSGNQRISFTNPVTGTGAHTISAWVNQQTVTTISAVVTLGTNATDQARFLYGSYAGNNVGVGLYNDDWTNANQDLKGAGWKLVHWTYEGPNKKSHLFVDGVEIMPAKTFAGQANTPAGTGYIGYAPEPSFGNPTGMLGQLDEVRISTTMRTPAWCAAEFANQSSPGTFYAVGAEQASP
jgi:hypothetical protein